MSESSFEMTTKTDYICGFELTEASLFLASLLMVIGFLEIIFYSCDIIPQVGFTCLYGGCTFGEGNLEYILKIYNIIHGILYFIFGIVFLAGIVKSNVNLVKAFIYFSIFNIILTLTFFLISALQLSNFLSLSYIFITNVMILFLEVFFLYVGIKFKNMIPDDPRGSGNVRYRRLDSFTPTSIQSVF